MTLYLAAPGSTTHVVVYHSYFFQNKGGGVQINQVGSNSSLTVNVTSSHFIRNRAYGEGGGIYIQQDNTLVIMLVQPHPRWNLFFQEPGKVGWRLSCICWEFQCKN